MNEFMSLFVERIQCSLYIGYDVEEGDEEEGTEKNACKALYERIPLHHNMRSMKQTFYFSCKFKGLQKKKEGEILNWKRIRLKI